MTETAPTRRTRLTDVPSAYPDERESGYGYVWRFWVVVVLWAAVVAERSAALGIPVRDPEGQMFRNRLAKALVFLVVIALVEAVVRARSPRVVAAQRRPACCASAGPANGCSWWSPAWSATTSSTSATATSRAGTPSTSCATTTCSPSTGRCSSGHSPWVMLHTLLGESYAAEALAVVYRSFTYVIVLALVGSLALIPRVRKAYVFLSAATWAWILGTLCYYVLPSLGPYAAVPRRVRRAPATRPITDTQAEYLAERAAFLADPSTLRRLRQPGRLRQPPRRLHHPGLPDGALLRPAPHEPGARRLPGGRDRRRRSTSAGTTSSTTSPACSSR